jgi:hypothetical protein
MFCFVSIKRSTYGRGLKPFFYYIPELTVLANTKLPTAGGEFTLENIHCWYVF